MSQFDDFDDDENGPEWWEPPEEVVTHAGTEIPVTMIFFEPPPAEIGKVLSAWSSLKEGKEPHSGLVQLLIVGMVAIGITLALLVIAAATFGGLDPDVVYISIGFGLLAGIITYFVSIFRHQCSYVGEQGVAILKIRGDWDSEIKEQLLLFEDAVSLNAAQTRNYTNGIYTGTSYDFTWKNGAGERLMRLNGNYHSKTGNPKEKSPFHLARMAEHAWNIHLTDRLQDELDEYGYVEFLVNKKDAVRVGPQFIEFCFKGRTERVPAHAIKNLSINNGIFAIHTNEAKWFSSKGKFSFNYSSLANAGMFIFSLERLLGYEFSD
ncbi:hypothetical protein [Thalassoroseus pseudoceratinae]|uniref:hypothetical protein n=1 Tax=Thalassoroseus pseudoceratinae TaxID=2713176 RepID=UPI00141F4AFD|nr:hypothetical protein [Thalassoroseus pseudoceratinae]